VDVELDLFGQGVVTVGDHTHTVQLLVGRRVLDEAFGELVAAHNEQAAAAE
jgi:hypothetical protein